ncbi:DUF4159 domain-containing protein [bacterium]|nr:DUF4159 domain-containing protein [bacterium]
MRRVIWIIVTSICIGLTSGVLAQQMSASSRLTIALLKYDGGGDWYSGAASVANLLRFIGKNTNVEVQPTPAEVDAKGAELFRYPIIYVNGHGNIFFSEQEAANLRAYLSSGGFLFANDDYGMDKSFRREMRKIFPNGQLVELPFGHPIYHIYYEFRNGLPKIHEHDKLPPQGFGLFHEGRLVAFYDYQCDLGDGWEDADVHNDPPEKRRAAMEMGTNVILQALTD